MKGSAGRERGCGGEVVISSPSREETPGQGEGPGIFHREER